MISIHLNRSNYESKDQVDGICYITLYQNCNNLKLIGEIEGYEEAFWVEKLSRTGDNNSTEYYLKEHKFSEKVYTTKLILSEINYLYEGSHQISFSLLLNDSVSNSYNETFFMEDTNCYAKIFYQLKVYLVENSTGRVLLENIQGINIVKNDQNNPHLIEKFNTITVKCCNCIGNYGKIDVAAVTNNKIYIKEDSKIILDINNKSVFDIKKITIRLIRRLDINHNLSHKLKDFIISEANKEGVLKGNFGKNIDVILSNNLLSEYTTNKGKFINVSYFYKIILSYDYLFQSCYNNEFIVDVDVVNNSITLFNAYPKISEEYNFIKNN